ncbi:hypothetical protein H0H87_001020 [Tephrocybe sp. NHM501043]|nr:hypothetical protein H0H87_001020 [Tephrocybe sp. NHM501043]
MRMKIGHHTAWITIAGAEQLQYSIEYSPDGTLATCWIASQAGKNFSVSWQDSLRAYSTSGHVDVDGIKGNGRILDGNKLNGDGILSMNSFTTSATTHRLFMFSELELTDDDQYLQKGAPPDLGDIKLVIYRCQVLDVNPTSRRNYAEPEKIHERSKKAMGHRCKLGQEVERPFITAFNTNKVEKLATFVFKYRPLAQLQANGIVPQDKHVQDKKRKRVAPSNEVIDLSQDEPPISKRKQGNRNPVKPEPGVVKQEGGSGGGIGEVRHLGVIDLT